MNEIFLSRQAVSDLRNIQGSGTDPESSAKIVGSVLKRLRELAEYDGIGQPLAPMLGYESSYRFLICGSHLAFYRCAPGAVYVDRVLYSRRDYIKIPFAGCEGGS
jgi:plasmid stabilization system protein ParE